MKKIVIAGGTGFLGGCLADYFNDGGHEIIILSRRHHMDTENIHYCKWDGKSLGAWKNKLENAEALINLTGKSVDCRYTEENKEKIYDSRIDATYILGQAVQELAQPPRVWINAASATIYRHALDREMDEESGEPGQGFSVDVCRKWEQTFCEANTPRTRKVILRIAIVLGNSGGALQPLKGLARAGIGGKQGPGNQYFSWLHETDFVRIIDFAINNDIIEGIYNASAPHPVTNKEAMKMIRAKTGVPVGLPIPGWLLKIGAVLIGTETELILKSRRVVPGKLLQSGFKFKYANLDEALKAT